MKATRYVSMLLATALVAVAAPAQGQVDDVRWLPFVGCWEPVGEGEDAGLLCFRPAPGGVEMTSVSDGEVVATEVLVADGESRPIVSEGCEGFEAVTFSEDGRRAFTRSDYACGDDPRAGTGVMAFVTPRHWTDVRSLEIQGEKVAWSQDYELVGPDRLEEEGIQDPQLGLEGSIRGARLVASRDVDLDDVHEAVARMDEDAVVTWIATRRERFDFDGADLLALADAGVPDAVIDVVVAVSYPDRFVVAPERMVAEVADEPIGRRIPLRVGYRGYMGFDPLAYGSFPFGYRYGYSYGFGYNPYGYGYGYGYGPYGYGSYGYGATTVRVERRAPSNGRAVSGRGWTRTRGGDSGRTARRPGAGASSSGRAWSGSRGGSAGSTSRGTARSSGGRTAKPRGGR